MTPAVLHSLRLRSRRVAAATVTVFALNWLGLALAPCAMAFTSSAPTDAAAAPVVATAGADSTVHAHPPGCPGHSATAAPVVSPEAGPADAHPCPWCPDAGATGGSHDAECAATPKPALDGRDAKNPVTPLLVALSAAVLGVVPVAAIAGGWPNSESTPPPGTPAADRYCRRLE